ncbi:MAG TPA: CopD family protein [Anaerolineales bacterium]|nr:CopD family protein [Anaerolineales bacterium]
MAVAPLAIAYWLHMAATVVWVGGLVFQSAILAPSLPPDSDLLERVRRRFEPLAWLSLAVLIGTGLIQMSASPNYSGLLSIRNGWSAAILAKHAAIGVMVLAAAYQTWAVQPRLARLQLALAAGLGTPETKLLLRRRRALLNLQTATSVLVLALTAIARSM